MLAFVDAFIQRPEAVPEEVRAALAEHFAPAQIVELAVAMAAFLGFSKVRIALGLVPDAMDLRVVPTPDVPDAPPTPAPDRDR